MFQVQAEASLLCNGFERSRGACGERHSMMNQCSHSVTSARPPGVCAVAFAALESTTPHLEKERRFTCFFSLPWAVTQGVSHQVQPGSTLVGDHTMYPETDASFFTRKHPLLKSTIPFRHSWRVELPSGSFYCSSRGSRCLLLSLLFVNAWAWDAISCTEMAGLLFRCTHARSSACSNFS